MRRPTGYLDYLPTPETLRPIGDNLIITIAVIKSSLDALTPRRLASARNSCAESATILSS